MSLLCLQDMDTEQPRIVLEGGLQLQGSYEDNLGTLMLFEHQQQGNRKVDGEEDAKDPVTKSEDEEELSH